MCAKLNAFYYYQPMEVSIKNLVSAAQTLKTSMQKLEEHKHCDFADMLEASCIKRFEYTLEIARKTMKRVLKNIYGKSEEELTVNNVFRFMQGYKFIPNWENWRVYYEKRNNTALEYNLVGCFFKSLRVMINDKIFICIIDRRIHFKNSGSIQIYNNNVLLFEILIGFAIQLHLF